MTLLLFISTCSIWIVEFIFPISSFVIDRCVYLFIKIIAKSLFLLKVGGEGSILYKTKLIDILFLFQTVQSYFFFLNYFRTFKMIVLSLVYCLVSSIPNTDCQVHNFLHISEYKQLMLVIETLYVPQQKVTAI